MIYKRADDSTANVTMVTVDNRTLSVELKGLSKFRNYFIKVSGFTGAGNGNASVASCWTDQDGEFLFRS